MAVFIEPHIGIWIDHHAIGTIPFLHRRGFIARKQVAIETKKSCSTVMVVSKWQTWQA
jgi:hypothetical protein